jgi:hypothetical protein
MVPSGGGGACSVPKTREEQGPLPSSLLFFLTRRRKEYP